LRTEQKTSPGSNRYRGTSIFICFLREIFYEFHGVFYL
jgi:hypothetical protein